MKCRSYPSSRTGSRLLLFLLLVTVLGGCGKKMPPLPPETLLPGPVRDFSLRQEGNALLLSWRRPLVTTEGFPLTDLRGFRIWRGEADLIASGCPPALLPWQEIELAYPIAAQLEGDLVYFRDADLQPGRRYYYQVAGFSQEKIEGSLSPLLSHAWDILPSPPEPPTVQAGDRVVRLTWTPVTRLMDGRPAPESLAYNVYRRQDHGPWSRINPEPLTAPVFEDLTVTNDITYEYLLRSLRPLAGEVLESPDSLKATARPLDLTPPAPVQQLVAVPTSQGIELRWLPSPEPDVAGYRVWRRAAAEPQPRLLTPQLLTQPYFVDREAEKGQLYYYTVTAVDNSRQGNESQAPEPVTARRP